MWLFKKQYVVNLPEQKLPKKVLEVINLLDTTLCTDKPIPSNSVLHIQIRQIPLNLQHKSAQAIVDMLMRSLDNNTTSSVCIIPRSIAFTTSFDGSWNFFIGVRSSVGSDPAACEMFMSLLAVTNNARA